jgi:hypothetical protein
VCIETMVKTCSTICVSPGDELDQEHLVPEGLTVVDSDKQSVDDGPKFTNLIDGCFVMTNVWTSTLRVSESQR